MLTADEARALLHEVQVHQIELELQNEDLQHAELESRQAAEKYVELFDFAPVGAFVLDLHGTIREVNLAGAALLGRDRQHISGQPFEEFLMPEARAVFRALCAGVVADDGRRTCETQLFKLGQGPWAVQIDLVPAKDAAGQNCGCRLSVFDITERKRYEEQLHQLNAELEAHVAARTADLRAANEALHVSEERLRFALESCQIGAWDLDLVDHTAYRSLEHARIFGYKELLPPWTLEDFLRHVLPEYRTEMETLVREGIAAQRGWTYECQIRRADGEVRWIWLTGQYRTDSAGRSRVAGVVQDITARKQAEAQIKAALAEKEVLLKEIHHRVKNNLQIVASLLSLQAEGMTDRRLRRVFDDVHDRVCSMALVHEKLYQSGDLARVNFADYAASLLQALWHAHHAGEGVQLKLELAPVTLPIELAVPCGLILNELVSNALKHAFPDGRPGEIVLALEQEAATGTVSLRVRDNGIGLPVGLDLHQAHTLGLRLLQMLTIQVAGSVAAHSERGRGTEFLVTFQVKDTRHE